jgi:hypothetical protein
LLYTCDIVYYWGGYRLSPEYAASFIRVEVNPSSRLKLVDRRRGFVAGEGEKAKRRGAIAVLPVLRRQQNFPSSLRP